MILSEGQPGLHSEFQVEPAKTIYSKTLSYI